MSAEPESVTVARELAAQGSGAGGVRTAVIELAGAAAGFVVSVAFVGGLVFAARLQALKLPVDAGVSLLPTSVLVTAGLNTLVPAALLGAALVALAVTTAKRSRPRRMLLLVGTGVSLLLLVRISRVTESLSWVGWLALVVAALVATTVAAVVIWRTTTIRRLAYGLVICLGLFAATIEGAAELLPPTKLDFVTVHLKSGETTDGWFLASDSRAIYLAPNVLRSSVGAITVIPNSEMTATTVVREEADVRAVGVRKPSALVGNPREPGYSDADQARLNDLAEYAASLRVEPGWVYPPIVPANALDFLHDEEDFGSPGPIDFPAGIERAELSSVLTDPQLYVGRPIRVSGVVVKTHAEDSGGRFVLIADGDVRESEAYCSFWQKDGFKLRAGQTVELYATVLGWGSWSLRKGKRFSEVALECAAARMAR